MYLWKVEDKNMKKMKKKPALVAFWQLLDVRKSIVQELYKVRR